MASMERPLSHVPLLMAHEVDYISAACIVISKNLFDDLGGFSPEYGRGYYEDTDLAMNAREAIIIFTRPSQIFIKAVSLIE